MRALAIGLILLVASTPFGAALWTPRAAVDPLAGIAPLPADISDGDVLTLLALEMGLQPTRLPIPHAPADASIAPLVLALGTRAGLPIAAEDAAAFDVLDPRIKQPTITLLLAMQQAWDLRDGAFADWTADDYAAAEDALETRAPQPKVLTPDQMEQLINAAILLSDTIESVVIPQLELAAQAGVWPAFAVADPVGVLRIGSSGDDVETVDRILQLDARGDDVYRNTAGSGAAIYAGTPGAPVGVSVDLSGNDRYVRTGGRPAYGAGFFGMGLLYDVSGNDTYSSGSKSVGSGSVGIGLVRDGSGADSYKSDVHGLGGGIAGVGYLRDDRGDDHYEAGGLAGGYGEVGALGLLWDRAGIDFFGSYFGDPAVWGWGERDGRGWFVDETASTDTYLNMFYPHIPHPKACNTCEWRAGWESGRGNDNFGGLAYLIAKQDP